MKMSAFKNISALQDKDFIITLSSGQNTKITWANLKKLFNIAPLDFFGGKVDPTTNFTELTDGLYIPLQDGTYNGNVIVNNTNPGGAQYVQGFTFLIWQNGVLTKLSYPITIAATGSIESGNLNAVSGDTVYKLISKFFLDGNSIKFTLAAGQIYSDGTPNTSVNWLRTNKIPYPAGAGEVTIEGYGNYPSGNQDNKENLANHRVACFNGNVFLGFIPNVVGMSKLTFTPLPNTTDYMVQVEAGANVGLDIPNSPFYNSLKIYYGTTLQLERINTDYIRDRINSQQLLDIEASVNILDSILDVVYEPMSIATTVGRIRPDGSAASTPADYRRTSVTSTTSMAQYDPAKRVFYTGNITVPGEGVAAAAVFKNTLLQTLEVLILPAGNYVRHELNPPAGTAYIAVSSHIVDPILEAGVYTVSGGSSGAVSLYVDGVAGVDTNNGSSARPFKTINKALSMLVDKSKGTVIVSKGDYRENLALGTLPTGEFEIVNREGHTVRVLGSQKLEGFVKTAGYTNIYEANFTGTIPAWSRANNPIYEDKNPSKPILPSEYHPLQRNLSHRLPFTPIFSVASLADLDATPGSYFYDTASSKIYIHASDGSNVIENGFGYEIPIQSANSFNSAATTTKKTNIKLKGIHFRYIINGLASIGFARFECFGVSVLGTSSAGAFRVDTGLNILTDCEAGFCNGDGFNGHFSSYSGYGTLTDNRANYPTTIYRNCWTHDNYDDGESSHEHHNVIMENFLAEYNGDSGCRPSNDATYYVKDSVFRFNGWEVGYGGSAGKGEGFSVVNPVSGAARMGCRAILFNCESYGNNTGYGTISSSTNVIELIKCVARDNYTAEYFAGVGTMNLRNCLYSNADPAKAKVIGTGTINVINDTLVTA